MSLSDLWTLHTNVITKTSSTFLDISEMQFRTTLRFYLTPAEWLSLSKKKKKKNQHMWWGRENPWWEHKLLQPLWKLVQRFLKKKKTKDRIHLDHSVFRQQRYVHFQVYCDTTAAKLWNTTQSQHQMDGQRGDTKNEIRHFRKTVWTGHHPNKPGSETHFSHVESRCVCTTWHSVRGGDWQEEGVSGSDKAMGRWVIQVYDTHA